MAAYCKLPLLSNPLLLFKFSTKIPGLKGSIVLLTLDFCIKIATDVTRQPISLIVFPELPICIFDQLAFFCLQ